VSDEPIDEHFYTFIRLLEQQRELRDGRHVASRVVPPSLSQQVRRGPGLVAPKNDYGQSIPDPSLDAMIQTRGLQARIAMLEEKANHLESLLAQGPSPAVRHQIAYEFLREVRACKHTHHDERTLGICPDFVLEQWKKKIR